MSKLSRQQQIRRNLRIHAEEAKLAKIVSISPVVIDERIAQQSTAKQLVDLIDCTELVNEGWADEYCNRTGTFIARKPLNLLAQLINVHGMQRTKTILEYNQYCHYHPMWLMTDPQALNLLAIHDPIGYFVYSSSLMLEYFLTKPNCMLTSAPQYTLESQQKYEQLTKEEASALASENSRRDYTGNNRRILWLDRITANKQLQTGIIPIDTIMETNELIRRMLALIHPSKMYKLYQLKFTSLSQITANAELFQQFREVILNALKDLIRSITSRHKEQTLPNFVTYSDIIEIKRKMGGMSAFMQQKAIRAVNKSDAIAYDLRELFVDELTASRKTPVNVPSKPISKPAQTAKPFSGLKLGNQQTASIDPNQSQTVQPSGTNRLAALLKGSK